MQDKLVEIWVNNRLVSREKISIEMTKEIFGHILKNVRITAGLSQDQLAELVLIDRSYISLLERGLRQPTVTTLLALGDALGVKASVILQRIEKLEYQGQDAIDEFLLKARTRSRKPTYKN